MTPQAIPAALTGALIAVATGALAKPGTPGPHYFVGTFERIGRSGGAGLDDRVRIEVTGQSVAIRACTGPALVMGFGPAFEIENLMTGALDGVSVDCLFHNNGYNRPILTCRMADGGAFTLWPLADVQLDCP